MLYTATSENPAARAADSTAGERPEPVAGRQPRPGGAHRSERADPASAEPAGGPFHRSCWYGRPDVEQAEAPVDGGQLRNIGVARAQFFPQLTLSASGGVGGDTFPTIFNSGSRTIYGLGQLAQPLF